MPLFKIAHGLQLRYQLGLQSHLMAELGESLLPALHCAVGRTQFLTGYSLPGRLPHSTCHSTVHNSQQEDKRGPTQDGSHSLCDSTHKVTSHPFYHMHSLGAKHQVRPTPKGRREEDYTGYEGQDVWTIGRYFRVCLTQGIQESLSFPTTHLCDTGVSLYTSTKTCHKRITAEAYGRIQLSFLKLLFKETCRNRKQCHYIDRYTRINKSSLGSS